MRGKYRKGLTESTPRKAIQPEEMRPPAEPDILPPLPAIEPDDFSCTWRERLALYLSGFRVLRERTSLQSEESIMNGRTTWVGIVKVVMGLLGTFLAGSGIDVEGGTLMITSGTAPLVIAALVGYFMLSGVQAYLTQDRDGRTGKTTVVGIIKATAGVLGTVLLALGLDVGAGGAVAFDPALSIWVIVLYLAYLLLSAVQAVLTRGREERGVGIAVL